MTMTHGQRYGAAIARVVKIRGDNTETLRGFNAAITAKFPRVDLIADQAEAYAAKIEAAAVTYADLTGNMIDPVLFAGECEEEIPDDYPDNGVQPLAHTAPMPYRVDEELPY